MRDEERKEEDQWIRRVQAGKTEVFEKLIRRYEKPIFNLLLRYLGDEAEAADVAQEVFIAAYRAIGKFRSDSRFSTWLYRIAINQAKNNQIRLAKARKRDLLQAPVDGRHGEMDNEGIAALPHKGPGPDGLLEKKEIQQRVQAGLKALKAEDRLLIVLHDLQGLAYGEITHLLDLPLGTLKSRLHRARQALKRELLPHYASEKGGNEL